MSQTRKDNPAVMGFDFQRLQNEMANELGFSAERISALANRQPNGSAEAKQVAELEEQSHSS